MAKIYTRKGDKGETALFDGTRTSKANPRVNLYGEVDELNSWLGLCVALLHRNRNNLAAEKITALDGLCVDLRDVQNDLFEMGAILADPARSMQLAATDAGPLPFSAKVYEGKIDYLNGQLAPLSSFILPGGHETAAALHLARTACRRVERDAVALAQRETLPAGIIVTLNRLSDYLFIAARWANRVLGFEDQTWQSRSASTEDGDS